MIPFSDLTGSRSRDVSVPISNDFRHYIVDRYFSKNEFYDSVAEYLKWAAQR